MIIIVILIQNLSYLMNHYRKGYLVSFKGETLVTVVNINENNFEEEVVKSSLPCLVDFWAEWCGPCKNLAPILEEISNELKEKVKIGKINIDDNQELAAKFSIRSIPTMILFKDGNSIDTKVGLPPKKELLDWIETKI